MLETIFSACSGLAMAGWLLLILLPRQRHAQAIAGFAIPLAISVVYLVLIARHFAGADGGFGSLAEVARLFSQPAVLLAGWCTTLPSTCSSAAGKRATPGGAACRT